MIKRILKICCLAFLVTCCKVGGVGPHKPQSPVVVLFENDVHCAVDGYAKLAAQIALAEQRTPFVTVVSSGDFVQGDVVGSVTQGESIIDIMNQVGYDYVTLGNHEFDFGMQQMKNLAQKLAADVVCANFTDLSTGQLCFSPYGIEKYGDVEIAFIGLATPATATSASPRTFQDAEGNLLYTFNPHSTYPESAAPGNQEAEGGADSYDKFFSNAQKYIDLARADGADYVVVLSHLGDVKEGDYPTSEEFVGKTKGVDVVLDGHSHTVIPQKHLQNTEGEPVLVASAGSYFEYVGKLELSVEGEFSVQLLKADTLQGDAAVAGYVEKVKQGVLEAGERIVGESLFELPALDGQGEWLVRERETAVGNFCADAFRMVLGTDIAMINGGGIRSGIGVGDITYNDLLSVFPFGNTACTVSLSGEQLRDVLEVSVRALPGRSGSFMQVSGVRFKVDASVEPALEFDGNGLFVRVKDGAQRRVSCVEVLDKDSGKYVPVVADRIYTLGGIDYNLMELGSDGMFRYTKPLQDNLGLDVDILERYLHQFLDNKIGEQYAAPQVRHLWYLSSR